MFFSQMGYLMLITYLPPTSHLQFYNLQTYLLTHPPTYLPTHLLKRITYLPIQPPITYLHINYLPTHPPTYLYVLPTYLSNYL